MIKFLYRFFTIVLFFAFVGLAATAYIFWQFSHDLPDYSQLKHYKPPVTSRVHAGSGELLAEFATQKRIFVPINVIPKPVIAAFLSAEDKNFYSHPGIDFFGMVRAVVKSIQNMRQGKRLEGASTITQQVATNFLLNRDQSVRYKVRQIFLSFMIERAFTKDQILELYLNEIYFGRVYGVSAAALHYFDKSLEELEIEEMAYLAAIIKGPSNYHPKKHYDRAITRRNWVINRMHENGYISAEAAQQAVMKPLKTVKREFKNKITSEYFVEEVRRQIVERFGFKGLYEGGLMIRTSLDPELQNIATNTIRKGLEKYDRQRGWRGPIGHFYVQNIEPLSFETKLYGQLPEKVLEEWNKGPEKLAKKIFKEVGQIKGQGTWLEAIVLKTNKKSAVIGLKDGSKGTILISDVKWARQWVSNKVKGPRVSKVSQVLREGNIILVEKTGDEKKDHYSLRQIPLLQGAIIAMDPHTGRVLAATGGYDFEISEYNRSTQAKRQPGSSFKPFVYLAALLNGYAPNSIILDAPFIVEQGPDLPLWRPKNYSSEFYGPTPLRVGIEKSRNLMTVRLAHALGMDTVAETAADFGVYDNLPKHLSMVLGAGETTLLKLTSAYAMIVNGGKKIQPTFIDRIQNRYGVTIYKHDVRECEGCYLQYDNTPMRPEIQDARKEIIDPRVAYQMVTILEGVVKRGTGVRANSLGFPVAGKTGTTNDAKDAWFIGFTPDLVVGVYTGFDNPMSLGRKASGSSVALPIFKEFMQVAMKDKPKKSFRVPDGLIFAEADGITLPFLPGTEPGSGNIMHDPFWESGSTYTYHPKDYEGRVNKDQTPVREPQGLY